MFIRLATAHYQLLHRPSSGSNWKDLSTNETRLGQRIGNILKMGYYRALFHLFLVAFKQTTQCYNKINVKNVHQVSGAGIRNHNSLQHEPPPVITWPWARSNNNIFALSYITLFYAHSDWLLKIFNQSELSNMSVA